MDSSYRRITPRTHARSRVPVRVLTRAQQPQRTTNNEQRTTPFTLVLAPALACTPATATHACRAAALGGHEPQGAAVRVARNQVVSVDDPRRHRQYEPPRGA